MRYVTVNFKGPRMVFKKGSFYVRRDSLTECIEVVRVNYETPTSAQIVARRWATSYTCAPVLLSTEELVYITRPETWREHDIENLAKREVRTFWRA